MQNMQAFYENLMQSMPLLKQQADGSHGEGNLSSENDLQIALAKLTRADLSTLFSETLSIGWLDWGTIP